MTRILIADDHALFRLGLKDILLAHFKDGVIAGAGTADEALEVIRKSKWDILLLDLSMPGHNGLEILKDIKQAGPKTHVLIISGHPEEQYALRVLKAGASGYITKLKAPREILNAVTKVLAGELYVTPWMAQKLAMNLSQPVCRAPHETLSDRELEVLLSIGDGKSVKEISADLNLSIPTVSTYRMRLLKKMGMQTSVELVRYAIKNQLVD